MRLVSLTLRNYRNYARLQLELGPHLNVFLGQNAQGKTNLLESVAILALSSSPRARREADLIGPLGPDALVEALVETGGRSVELSLRVSQEGERASKTIRVDGLPRRAVDLPGEVQATLFWPEDLSLVKGGPEHRRRFLNEMLVQVMKGYGRSLGRYRRVLDQRNHLLRRINAGQEGRESLSVWDAELAALGTTIIAARGEAVAELAPLAAANHAAIAEGETLVVAYSGAPVDLATALGGALEDDLRRGSTSVGPHRDDLSITIQGTDARSFASQGQQRTAVVSLKLAESDLIEARSGQRPILLLDDVLSELDPARRSALLARVGETGQVIVTSVEAEPFPADLMERAAVRCITGGRVEACG
ncbi:MAG: DNA replication/repair protein RecF [Candidatus Dormibacteraeota bacterium]|nr:DNA replication/repair protein RecF [Candidatus Dormibacteraeota bacterium]